MGIGCGELKWHVISREVAEDLELVDTFFPSYLKRYRFISPHQPSIEYNKTYLAKFITGDKISISWIVVRLAQIPGSKAYPR